MNERIRPVATEVEIPLDTDVGGGASSLFEHVRPLDPHVYHAHNYKQQEEPYTTSQLFWLPRAKKDAHQSSRVLRSQAA
jgi:hypothetical protein